MSITRCSTGGDSFTEKTNDGPIGNLLTKDDVSIDVSVAGCSTEKKVDTGDSLAILKTFLNFEEDDNTRDASETSDHSEQVYGFEQQFMFGHITLSSLSKQDQMVENSETIVHDDTGVHTDDTVVHIGDTDSSDNEYNEYGLTMKRLLASKHEGDQNLELPVKRSSLWNKKRTMLTSLTPNDDVSTIDSLFGIRVTSPMVSSAFVTTNMQGRELIPICRVKQYMALKRESEFVIPGVIVQKTPMKLSNKGVKYCGWRLSDLKDSMKTLTLFLFRDAVNDLWKLSEGTAVALLNPHHLVDRKFGIADETVMSVDSCKKVLTLGTSKDFGICKATKKNGEKCSMFVNKSKCEYCVYHLKSEYKSIGRRQTKSTSGGLLKLQNKVLGKNEIFYGGKSFSAAPSTAKMKGKSDQKLKSTLVNMSQPSTLHDSYEFLKKQAQVIRSRIKKDSAILYKLQQKRTAMSHTVTSSSAELASPTLGITKTSLQQEATLNKKQSSVVRAQSRGELMLLKSGLSSNLQTVLKLDKSDISISSPCSKSPRYKQSLQPKKCELSVSSSCESRKSRQPLKSDRSEVSSPCELPKYKHFSKKDKDKSESSLSSPYPESLNSKHSSKSDESESLVSSPCAMTPKSKQVSESESSFSSPCDKLPKCQQLSKSDIIAPRVQCCHAKVLESLELRSEDSSETELQNKSVTSPDDVKMLPVISSSTVNPQDRAMQFSTKMDDLQINCDSHGRIDLNTPVNKAQKERAKRNAKLWIEKYGPIKKLDPNSTRKGKAVCKKRKSEETLDTHRSQQGSRRKLASVKGREISSTSSSAESSSSVSEPSQSFMISPKFQELLKVTSRHKELLKFNEEVAQDVYFQKLEKKEQLERKMLQTYKVQCKGVRCCKCKYTSFTPSELCLTEQHQLRFIDIFQRFFKCKNCTTRTYTLNSIIPTIACKNCGSSNWERAPMIRETKSSICAEPLSIRGDEESFLGTTSSGGSLNLMVPE